MMIDGLEIIDGKARYLHSRDCQGYCDYSCNHVQGEQVAAEIERLKRLASSESSAKELAWCRIDELSLTDPEVLDMARLDTAGAKPELITEDWLREVGFKWHQLERQTDKQWLLWLGSALGSYACFEDLGIEITIASWKNAAGHDVGRVGEYNCWLRSDAAGRYHRFIHVRYLRTRHDVIALVEALTGQQWNPANNIYGSMLRPDIAEIRRREFERLDIKHNIIERPAYLKWHEIEKDDSRGRALPEHYEAHEKAKGKP